MKSSRQRGRFVILERDRFRCIYCGASQINDEEVSLTVDHIVPVNGGGSDRADNLVTCCENCNSQKQDRRIDRDSQRQLQAKVRERNQANNIPNGLMIVMGKTSAERRSRQRWQSIMVRAFQTWEGLMRDIHEVEGNLGPSYRLGQQCLALMDVYILAIYALTDYTRLTGDAEKASALHEMLEQAVIELHVAGDANFMQHDGLDKVNLEEELVACRKLAGRDLRENLEAKIGTVDIEYVKSGRGAIDLLKSIQESRDEAEEAVRLAGERDELRTILAAVVQQYLAERLSTSGIDREA